LVKDLYIEQDPDTIFSDIGSVFDSGLKLSLSTTLMHVIMKIFTNEIAKRPVYGKSLKVSRKLSGFRKFHKQKIFCF
jgi:hypothetical protein